eukprot:Sdes_comp15006_c0_seq1m3767
MSHAPPAGPASRPAQRVAERANPHIDTNQLISALSSLVTAVVAENDRFVAKKYFNYQYTPFDANCKPAISIAQYLARIGKYAPCSVECFILGLIYVDRAILHKNTGRSSQPARLHSDAFMLNSLNAHRLLITTIMTAAKFFDDIYYKNELYARVGGVPNPELNGLEINLLFRLNFHLNVSSQEFDHYRALLLNASLFQAQAASMPIFHEQQSPSSRTCLSFLESTLAVSSASLRASFAPIALQQPSKGLESLNLQLMCSLLVEQEAKTNKIAFNSKANLLLRASQICREISAQAPLPISPSLQLPLSPFDPHQPRLRPLNSGDVLKRVCEALVHENHCLSPGFIARSMKSVCSIASNVLLLN